MVHEGIELENLELTEEEVDVLERQGELMKRLSEDGFNMQHGMVCVSPARLAAFLDGQRKSSRVRGRSKLKLVSLAEAHGRRAIVRNYHRPGEATRQAGA